MPQCTHFSYLIIPSLFCVELYTTSCVKIWWVSREVLIQVMQPARIFRSLKVLVKTPVMHVQCKSWNWGLVSINSTFLLYTIFIYSLSPIPISSERRGMPLLSYFTLWYITFLSSTITTQSSGNLIQLPIFPRPSQPATLAFATSFSAASLLQLLPSSSSARAWSPLNYYYLFEPNSHASTALYLATYLHSYANSARTPIFYSASLITYHSNP